jgi:hypothetical protein
MTAKPYQLIALVADPPRPGKRQTGTQVLIGSYDTTQERDAAYRRERALWLGGGMDADVRDICRGEVHGMAPKDAVSET